MKKLTIFSALLALWGAALPVAAVESSIHHESVDAKLATYYKPHLGQYWILDDPVQIITNNDILKKGANFTNHQLQIIFNDLANSDEYKECTIELNDFLIGYKDPIINLSPIAQRIHRIGDNFLFDAKSLKEFDTNGLGNVTSIGNFFLNNASSLTDFNAKGLSNLKKIGDNFLCATESLTTFNTEGLGNVTRIGNFFLSNARSLIEFKAEGLISLKTIGHHCLHNDQRLKKLDKKGWELFLE